jgi:diguanylate cyclase (GGDEF)-like protein
MVGAVSAISTRDPSGASLRIGMVMVTVGAAMWLPWQQLVPAVLLAWLGPNFGRSLMEDAYALFNTNMMLELPGLLMLGGFASVARDSLRALEQENMLIGSQSEGRNSETGVFEATQLKPALDAELARSRRFGRTFSLVLIGIDEMRQKFDYRDAEVWQASLAATARLLRQTRLNVDRVFHYGANGFALILPESDEKDVSGLVRRLRRQARKSSPAEGEPGGPLPAHFGATFFPACATTVEDLMRRAEIAMRIAEKTTLRYQLDSAEAPELPPAETLRRPEAEAEPALTAPVMEVALESLEAAPAPVAFQPVEAPATSHDEDIATLPSVVEEAQAVAAAAESMQREDEPEPADREVTIASQPGLEPVASSMAPVVEAAISASETPAMEPAAAQPGYVASAGASEPLDDIAELLKQMDKTLEMIRSVRSHAA